MKQHCNVSIANIGLVVHVCHKMFILVLCAKGTFVALYLIEMCRNEFLRILTNFKVVGKIRDFLRILKRYSTNSQSMSETKRLNSTQL